MKWEEKMALAEMARRGVPIMAGGASGTTIRAATAPLQTAYPLGPPTVGADGSITVPNMLNQPTRITRMIRDLSLERFLIDKIFTSAGGVTGGAVVYDVPDYNDLFSDRDVQEVSPGAEFPIVTSHVPIPLTALVRKWGGKVFITDEARDRNDSAAFTNEIRRLTNTIIRKLNQQAVGVVNVALAAYPNQTIPGHNWTSFTTQGTNPTPYAQQPVADFAAVELLTETQELGVEIDYIILNPFDANSLQLGYGPMWEEVLNTWFPAGHYVSNRQPKGFALCFASGQVGEMRVEKPLGTETWREPSTERTWVQSSVRPVMYVTNPFAVQIISGIAGP
jgi:hypothetical protein